MFAAPAETVTYTAHLLICMMYGIRCRDSRKNEGCQKLIIEFFFRHIRFDSEWKKKSGWRQKGIEHKSNQMQIWKIPWNGRKRSFWFHSHVSHTQSDSGSIFWFRRWTWDENGKRNILQSFIFSKVFRNKFVACRKHSTSGGRRGGDRWGWNHMWWTSEAFLQWTLSNAEIVYCFAIK